jgi:hypothetical protein
MKKQNETKTTTKVEVPVAKPKRMKKNHTFFLYVPERGFICGNDNGIPVVGWQKPLSYSIRSKAMYAAEFFMTMKLADEVALVTQVGNTIKFA